MHSKQSMEVNPKTIISEICPKPRILTKKFDNFSKLFLLKKNQNLYKKVNSAFAPFKLAVFELDLK